MLYIWHRNYSRSFRVFGVSLISYHPKGLSWPWSHGSWIYNYQCNKCLLPLMLWVRILIRARYITLCDKVCQWLEQVGGFLRPPVSSTNKTDRHDITENLLKVVLTTFKQTDKLTIPKTWQHHAMFQLSLRWHSSVMWKGSALTIVAVSHVVGSDTEPPTSRILATWSPSSFVKNSSSGW